MTQPNNIQATNTPTNQPDNQSAFDASLKHAKGFVEGMSEAGIDAAKGTYDLASGAAKIFYDLNPIGRMSPFPFPKKEDQPNLQRGLSNVAKVVHVTQQIIDDPMVIVDGVTQPIKQEWNQGNYGKAVGRGVTEGILIIVGPKGATNVIKTGRLSGVSKTAARMLKYDKSLAAYPGSINIGRTVTNMQRDWIANAEKTIANDKYGSILRNELDQAGVKISFDNIPTNDVKGWFNPQTNTVVVNLSQAHSVQDVIDTLVHEAQHVRRHNRGIPQGTQNAEYKSLRVESIVERSIKGAKKQPLGLRKFGWHSVKEAYRDLPQGGNPFKR